VTIAETARGSDPTALLMRASRGDKVRVHRCPVGTLWVAPTDGVRVFDDREVIHGDVIFVEAGREHGVHVDADAFRLFAPPVSAATGPVIAGMNASAEGVWTASPDRSRMIAAALQAVDASCRSLALLCEPESIDPRIARTVAALFTHPGDSCAEFDLACAISLSQSRFRALLKRETGLTLKRLRVWARVNWALRAARRSGNLTGAAHDAGFSSSSHLSSACRYMLGLTPSEALAMLFDENGAVCEMDSRLSTSNQISFRPSWSLPPRNAGCTAAQI